MAKQLVGIIVPTYNRKNFLLQCLTSLLEQKTSNDFDFFIVVVDDGSTDETFEAVCGRFKMTQKLTLIRIPNSERGKARNVGANWAIKAKNPNWLLFVDSDDFLFPGALLHLMERAKTDTNSNAVAVYGSIQVWEGEKRSGKTSGILSKKEGDISRYLPHKPILPLGATLVRSLVFKQVGGFSEKRDLCGSEDWIFLTKIGLSGPVLYAPHFITAYRQHSGNTHPSRFLASIDGALEELKPLLKEKYGKSAQEAIEKFEIQASFMKVGTLNGRGYHNEAVKLLGNTLRPKMKLIFDHRLYGYTWSILKGYCASGTLPVLRSNQI